MFYCFLECLLIITTSLCIIYFLMIASFCYGWIRTPLNSNSPIRSVSIAIIISARNEEKTISKCLESILAQTVSLNNFELIIVDDSSEDKTFQIANSFVCKFKNIQIFQLSTTQLQGKKNAIAMAISKTNAEWIITTDADCVMSPKWIEKMISKIEGSKSKMIVGPVSFHHENSVFQKFQSLEFMALIASAAGALFYNKSIMCNGANLAYEKKAFAQVGGFDGMNHLVSGDDVLLMYKFKNRFKDGIEFLKDSDAIVYTKAKSSLAAFYSQRKRWASKGFLALNTETRLVSLIVYFFNFFLFIGGLITGLATIKSGIYLPFFIFCLILIGFKCFIDFLLLFLSASFFDKKRYLVFFLMEQFIYIFYVVIVGVVGNKGKYTWKGRKIN